MELMNTKTRFQIGDKVQVLGSRRKKIVCPFCNGNYKKIVDGNEFYCANCDEGMMNLETENVLVTATVTGINLDVRQCKVEEDDKDSYTYADETGTKDIEYYLDSDEEDVSICMTNEKKLIEWNKKN